MANPSSRQSLIDYCLRRLGEPVIEINVDPDQISDRVDEAIQYWQEFHNDATFRTYISHLVTETDVAEGYIPVDADVVHVTKLFPISSAFNTSFNFFDIKYQMMLNDIADLQNYAGDLAYYDQMQQYLSLLDMKLNGEPQVAWSRHENKLYIYGDFNDNDIKAGEYVVFEAYRLVDPSSAPALYNDIWLKEYTTALLKMQWGQNLVKFEGMQLPGGVTLNGRQIYEDALQEIERLRERMKSEGEMPVDFFVG